MLQTVENALVFVQEGQVATDSLRIAQAFEKAHDKVLRDIRALKCSDDFRLTNFGESSYINKQQREMPMFIVTYDGFCLLCMGYNGEKAMQFKERYIADFNRIRKLLESQQYNQRFLELEQNSTLLSYEQRQIQDHVRKVVHDQYPSLSNQARRKYFAHIYQQIKQRYNVSSFRDIPRNRFDESLHFIENYYSPNVESPPRCCHNG